MLSKALARTADQSSARSQESEMVMQMSQSTRLSPATEPRTTSDAPLDTDEQRALTAQYSPKKEEASTPPDPQPAEARHGTWTRLFSWIPTVSFFALLVGIGFWGHSSGWTIPRFSELDGKDASVADWCETHGVPESICVACNADLMP